MFSRLLVALPLVLSVLAAPTNDSDTADAQSLSCHSPSTRIEWRSFTASQKAAWISSVKCINSKPHSQTLKPVVHPSDIPPMNTSGSLYDDLVYVHMDVNHNIHFTGVFLPFHRWYLDTFERLMRNECGYKGPMGYWDWTKDSANPQGSTLFSPDPKTGLGNFGSADNGYIVDDGALANWRISYPTPHVISRSFINTPWSDTTRFPLTYLVDNPAQTIGPLITSNEVKKMTTSFTGDFDSFHKYLGRIQGPHTGVHLMVGGDMQDQALSPNDPLFWLHHGMIDRLWYLWQKNNVANKWSFTGGSVQALANRTYFDQYPNGAPPKVSVSLQIPNDGFGRSARVYDVMDTTGGYLCYNYA
jgi:tyrosinase